MHYIHGRGVYMRQLIAIPRGILSRTTTSTGIVYSVYYPTIGFTISADSVDALLSIQDFMFCPYTASGIESLTQLNIAIESSDDITQPIDISILDKVAS